MSFDLWVWKGPAYTLATINSGIARFESGDKSAFEASPRVAAFRTELLARIPAPEAGGDGSTGSRVPWASVPAASDRMLALQLSWLVADDQLDEVLRLVERHDLWLYDPQRALVQPPRSMRPRPAGAGSWLARLRSWLARLPGRRG